MTKKMTLLDVLKDIAAVAVSLFIISFPAIAITNQTLGTTMTISDYVAVSASIAIIPAIIIATITCILNNKIRKIEDNIHYIANQEYTAYLNNDVENYKTYTRHWRTNYNKKINLVAIKSLVPYVTLTSYILPILYHHTEAASILITSLYSCMLIVSLVRIMMSKKIHGYKRELNITNLLSYGLLRN